MIKKLLKRIRKAVKKTVIEKPSDRIVWTTAQGEGLRLVDIESDHLVNILKFLRKRKDHQDVSAWIQKECFYRDHRYESASRDALRMYLQPVEERFPVYETLRKEASKRGLI